MVWCSQTWVLLFNRPKTLNDLFFLHQNVVAQAKRPKLKQQPPRNQNPSWVLQNYSATCGPALEKLKNTLHILAGNSAATHGTKESKILHALQKLCNSWYW
jgi:hypothetical protein